MNGIRILIVEDDATLRGMMQDFISRAGHCPVVAATAEEAMEVLDTSPVDVMVADINLPGMSGLDLSEKVTAASNIAVILVTGYVDEYSYEQAAEKGASDFVVKPIRQKELLLRIDRALREKRLSREKDEMLENARRLAITDGLTHLYNSRHFYSQLKTEAERSDRYERQLSLLLIDVDKFKHYNDTYGHLKGDAALIRVASTVRSCLRTMDTAYRYGGEEFTIILPETGGKDAMTVAERIRAAVESESFSPADSDAAPITVSVGATRYKPKESLADFVQRADRAMYASKKEGGNSVFGMFEESDEPPADAGNA